MLLRIDTNATEPLFEQIATGLRRAIADGRAQRGEQLPTAKDLAESLGVNLHTVLRAYNALREEGLLDVRRGRGVVVTEAAPQRAELTRTAKAFLAEGRRLGLSMRELTSFLQEMKS